MSDKVIVFDLGKVIFDYDINIISRALSEFSAKQDLFNNMESFMYENDKLFCDYEKGLISSSDFYNKMISILEIKNLPFDKFADIWNKIFEPIQTTIDLISKLSKKHTLALLSNTNDLHFNYLYTDSKSFFDNNFQKLFLSYEMKKRKPEKDIYSALIDFYKTEPENIFFTDDNQTNIDVAKQLGIKAYKYENITKLEKDLKDFGIEI